MRQTVNLENDQPLLIVGSGEVNKNNKCMYAVCLFVSYSLFFGLGVYVGYLINKDECDGSL